MRNDRLGEPVEQPLAELDSYFWAGTRLPGEDLARLTPEARAT